jgi:hypothetical protein
MPISFYQLAAAWPSFMNDSATSINRITLCVNDPATPFVSPEAKRA